MSSRVVFAVILAGAIGPVASAAEELPHVSFTLQRDALAARPTTNAEIFAEGGAARLEVRENGMKVVVAPAVDVIVARIDSEGESLTGCVHDEQGLHEFMKHARKPVAAVLEEK